VANKIQLELVVDDKGTAHIKRFGRGVEDTAQKAETSIKRTDRALGALSTTLLSMASIYTAARFGQKIIADASALEEVTNKFNVVFRGQERQAEGWARTLVDSYAMSTREARQYLSSIQDLLKPMGMQAKAAGKLSFEIAKLSADLGSFNNLPTAKVMDDIQSALVGNYETMKKYGVRLNAALVDQEALTAGLAATKDELTAAHKAQAAYNLIVKGSKDAIGDTARSTGSYAFQVKQLNANFEELTTTLGIYLLPALTDLTREMNEFFKSAKVLERIPEWIDALKLAFPMWMGSPSRGMDIFEGIQTRREESRPYFFRGKIPPRPSLEGGGTGAGAAGLSSKDLLKIEKELWQEQLREYEQLGKDEYAMYFANTREAEEKILAYKRQKSDEALQYRILQYQRLGEEEAAMWQASSVSSDTYLKQYAQFVKEHGTLTQQMAEGVQHALDEQAAKATKTYDMMFAVTTEFAESSKLVMSTVLFDGIRGELEDFGDYFDLFLDRMVNTWARTVADMAVEWAANLGKDALSSVLGGGGGSGGILGAIEKIPVVGGIVSGIASLFHEGGVVGPGGEAIPLKTGEYVSVLKRGEVVLTQDMLRNLGISTGDLGDIASFMQAARFITAGANVPGVMGLPSEAMSAAQKGSIMQGIATVLGGFLLGSPTTVGWGIAGLADAAGAVGGFGHEAAGGFGFGPGYQWGGVVPHDMMARVHRGEGVFRPDQMRELAPVGTITKAIASELRKIIGSSRKGTGTVSIHIDLDSRRIYDGMYDATSGKKALIHPRAIEGYLETVGLDI